MANEGTDDYQPDGKKIESFERLSKAIEESKKSNHLVNLQLTSRLRETGIVSRFVFNMKTNSIILLLNHAYEEKNIIFTPNKKDWNKTHDLFQRKLKQNHIEQEHILLLEEVLDEPSNFETIFFGDTNNSNGN